ncbi:hypothetical protein P5673_009178 [Acropora cervicornis]|uniref:Uncharacterized protein n=1 Tax=Acropora cervicornis TaxID=6130 RepID=A0AAD9QSG4_ACRCE|nr:hypothetical protein P5673_009178 [Acropora cervicornis]
MVLASELLKYATTDNDDKTDDSLDKMEHLRLLPYVIGSHQKQLRSLIRNSVEYSRKCQELPAKHEFKSGGKKSKLKLKMNLKLCTKLRTKCQKDMSAKKQGYSCRSVHRVNFFHHFPRERLRSYGKVKEAIADSKILEYVVRLAVTFSKWKSRFGRMLPSCKMHLVTETNGK